MKELFIKILRFLMFVLVVALGCIGYNIYEDTLAAVWIPVGVGLVVAVRRGRTCGGSRYTSSI